MYDWPEVEASTDRLWALVRDRLRAIGLDAPETLSRDREPGAEWRDPDLLLSQTCGRPYATGLAEAVTLIGVPTHAPHGTPGRYHSVLVTRADSRPRGIGGLTGRRFAYNSVDSQSGFAAPLRMLIAAGEVSNPEPLETGAHRFSIRAVAEGRADWAAIDAVTWALALRHQPAARELAVFARTPETPALPLIAGKALADRKAEIAAAVEAAIADLAAADRDALFLTGFVPAEPDDYAALAEPFDPQAALPGFTPE